jgi:hypothetical protein
MTTVSMLKTRPNPVRFLLYTEWLMLMSCGSLAVMEMLEAGRVPIQHVLILLLLGLMGWVLPSGKPWEKVAYTAIKIGLIFYDILLGYLRILPSLYLIVVIRSCFIFDLPGRWAIENLMEPTPRFGCSRSTIRFATTPATRLVRFVNSVMSKLRKSPSSLAY